MAGKKPAKVNSSNKKETVIVLGKAVLYKGSKDAKGFECPTCKRSLIKGIIYEHTDANAYCSRRCIPKVEAVLS